METDLARAQAAAVAVAEQLIRSRPRPARPQEEFLLAEFGGPCRALPTATPGIYLVWVLTAPATARRVRQPGWQTWWSQRRGRRVWEASKVRGAVGPLPPVLVAAFQAWIAGVPPPPDPRAQREAAAALTALFAPQPALEAAYLAWLGRLRRSAARGAP